MSTRIFRLMAGLALSSTLFACVYDNDPPKHLGGDPDVATPSYDGSSSGSTADAGVTTPTSTAPMLVTVDTGQVLNADPGEGVGIFTEYAAGGLWHVWWTCDTNKSQLPCDVQLTATAASGVITAFDSTALQGAGNASQPDPTSVAVTVTTTTQLHGITFTTDPGATITLQATIGGLSVGPGTNQSFFFFVQDGLINGGYTGTLTNPLQLKGNTP